MAFDPDAFLKDTETKGFDPDQFLKEDTDEIIEQPSQLESGVRGAAQGLTLGFADELTAAAETALKTAVNPSEITNILENYRKARDESRLAYEAAQQANPKTYLAGELGGGIVPVLGTGGAATGASLGRLAVQGAKMGATYGAASGLGTSEADLTKGEIGQAVGDVAKGTAAGTFGGAALGVALPVAGKAIGKVGEKLSETSLGKKVLGAPTETMNKLEDTLVDAAPELGQTAFTSAKLAYQGFPLVGAKVRKSTVDELANEAEKFISTADDVVRARSAKEVSDVIGADQQIEFGENLVKYLKDVDDKLAKTGATSDEGRQLSAIKASLEVRKNQILEKMGIDPTDKPYQTVLKEFQKLKGLQTKSNSDAEAIAINKLYDRMVKTKGTWEPKDMDILEITRDFNLQNPEEAINLVRDVARLKYNKQKITKNKEGEITKVEMVPNEFREIVQKYTPEIVTEGNIMRLRTAPGKYSKSEYFQPEVSKLDYNLTPQQLMDFRKELRALTVGKSDVVKSLGAEIDKDITSSMLSKVPAEKKAQFDKAMETYRQLYDLEELIGAPLQTPNRVVGGEIIKGEPRAEHVLAKQKVGEFLERQMSGLGGEELRLPKEQVEKIVGQIPEFGKDWSKNIQRIAQQKDIQNILFKSSNIRPTGTWSSMAGYTGVVLGKIAKGIKGGMSAPTSLANIGKEGLEGLAQVSRNKGLDRSAEFFTNLANTTSDQRKNALMFVASQNPNFKEEMKTLFSDYPEEDIE